MMAGDGKSFLVLVNGLTRHDYYNDTEITDEFLHNELYPNLPDDEFMRLIQKARGITNSLAVTAMDLSQAETFLETQMKRKKVVYHRIKRKHSPSFGRTIEQKSTIASWRNVHGTTS
ncbi:hypothetical protein LSAT2_009229 [Lamellibrachia satsuma]|nr:hypothetical protein LSAT2_009229 [Lamellibrachia satsuma]